MDTRLTFSNSLILICIVFTILVTVWNHLYIFGMNNVFLDQWLYHIYFIQFFTGSFIHWWLLHLFANSIFLYIFWNAVEWIIWKKKFFIFFVFVTIFNWVLLSLFAEWNTVWISWFCMALISYFTLELRSRNNPEYKWWVTAIVLNILIWFMPWISLFWHLFWAIAWVVYYLINKDFFRRKYVGAVDAEA